MLINQVSVFMENRAGQLAEITAVLADHEIDMRAINITETADYGVLRLIVDRPVLAVNALTEAGFVVKETPVVAMNVPDRPGGLNEAVSAIARANIDIKYMYSVFGHKNGRAYMIFKVKDIEGLVQALDNSGFSTVGTEELGVN